ncbi:MAG TPA: cobalamin-binding protein [Candidatus Binataceae bacterium]|nr:cobalamin-binding protein [Candidatus Binataceae bacterium]
MGRYRRAGIFALIFIAVCAGRADADAPMRLISLAPSVTEILFALGAGPEVAGVSDYCDYPPQVRTLPHVGSFLTPNIEAIMALHPTLVIGIGLSSDVRQIRALESMGYPVLLVKDDSFEQIEKSIVTIGERIGRAARAHEIAAGISAQVAAVQQRLNKVSPMPVLMIVGHQPIVAVGRGTYLSEMLQLARADNIAAVSGEEWPQLSLEYIIAMRPAVILDGSMGNDPNSQSRFWDAYPSIPAVRDRRVFGYPQDPILHSGPRVGESLEMIARLVHPAVFAAAAEPHK